MKGFEQKQDINCYDIFTPVIKITTIRLVLRLVVTKDLYLEQLYVKTTFLHGDLVEEIYI